MADNNDAAERAYKAGYALPTVDWTPVEDVVPPEVRVPGVHHCPFAEGDPLRAEWLQGLRDALDRPQVDTKAVVAEIDKELSA